MRGWAGEYFRLDRAASLVFALREVRRFGSWVEVANGVVRRVVVTEWPMLRNRAGEGCRANVF
jgi:hypothetical protein